MKKAVMPTAKSGGHKMKINRDGEGYRKSAKFDYVASHVGTVRHFDLSKKRGKRD